MKELTAWRMCKIGQSLPFENKKILGEIENCSLEEIK